MTGSIYVHVPFCKRKCDYCHFYVLPDKQSYHEILLEGLKLEWKMRESQLAERRIVSLYFGGGTPALFGPEAIGQVIQWASPYLENAEITLEANPENITREMMAAYRQVGINRVSIGVQSLNDSLLETLSRGHSAAKAIEAVKATHAAGIDNITIDLMYDLPGQTLASWKQTLAKALELPISHLSLYNLTIEPHTVFFKMKEKLEKQLPDPEESKEMYLEAVHALNKGGLTQYEISAFGRPSRHNTGYWTGRPFLGFGPSAFSYWENCRFRNIANLSRYHQQLLQGIDPVDFSETLDPQAQLRERLVIALRLLEGVELSSSLDMTPITPLIADHLLKIEGGRLKLTEKGILFYDTVAAELV